MRRGLAVISVALGSAQPLYRRLRAPGQAAAAAPAPLDVAPWIRRVVGWKRDCTWQSSRDRSWRSTAIADQLEQVLINLLRNAADAALETGGGVRVGWRKNARTLRFSGR